MNSTLAIFFRLDPLPNLKAAQSDYGEGIRRFLDESNRFRKIDLFRYKFIHNELKPQYVKRPPKNNQFNYIVDIYTKWHRHSLFFCAKYRSSGGEAEFESKFARLEHLKTGKFDVAYFRHTGKWWVTDSNLSFNEALKLIGEGGPFEP